MALNPYFASTYTQGEVSEQDILEDMVVESIDISGQELFYIPREYVAKDEILGEDRLSKFTKYYSVNCYFKNVEGFAGAGAFIQKFGYMLEQSASLSIAKKSWAQLVGAHGTSILPNRPAEGDLLYFPLADSLFEIKFVEHQDPFYQLGRQYVYELKVELYQYSSEHLDTGNVDIDSFETEKTHDITLQPNIDVPDSYGDNTKIQTETATLIFDRNNPFGDV